MSDSISPIAIVDELKQSYLDYAMSVIVSRALPDVRDGFKPVHRRVMYAMHVLSNDYNKAYKKSARVWSVTSSVNITRMAIVLFMMRLYVWRRTLACVTRWLTAKVTLAQLMMIHRQRCVIPKSV